MWKGRVKVASNDLRELHGAENEQYVEGSPQKDLTHLPTAHDATTWITEQIHDYYERCAR